MHTPVNALTRLSEIVDLDDLREAIRDGYVREQVSRDGRLVILNYTSHALFEGAWNAVTTTCRGLIYDRGTSAVIARPVPKFFNYGQPEAPHLDMQQLVEVIDKVDGSLGIFYEAAAGTGWYSIALRSSFTGRQALHATEVYRNRYLTRFTPPDGWTVLVEIIYPGNRVVCDYGTLDDLVLLGAVHIATGRVVGPADPVLDRWPGPRAEVFGRMTVAEVLALPPRPGAEGVVLRADDGTMLKIKQDDYLRLHKVVTGLNERVVWEWISTDRPVRDLVAKLPDEFHPWVFTEVQRLQDQYAAIDTRVIAAFAAACRSIFGGLVSGSSITSEERKQFAIHVQAAVDAKLRGLVFGVLDGWDIKHKIWDMVRPAASARGAFGRTTTDEEVE